MNLWILSRAPHNIPHSSGCSRVKGRRTTQYHLCAPDAQQFVPRSTSTSCGQEIPQLPARRDHFWTVNRLKRRALSCTEGPPCAPMLETAGLRTDDTEEGAESDGVWSGIIRSPHPRQTADLLIASGSDPLRTQRRGLTIAERGTGLSKASQLSTMRTQANSLNGEKRHGWMIRKEHNLFPRAWLAYR